MNFDAAFQRLLKHEGGYVNHPSDPGGATNMGITEAVARRVGYKGAMQDLPVDLAKRIYLEEYWKPMRAEELPPAVRYAVFDAAVNSGVSQSTRWLQRALGVADDGALGPKTLAAANAANPDALRARLVSQRMRFLTNLNNFDAFGRGWSRRCCDILEN
jgi:lysozyme family protein